MALALLVLCPSVASAHRPRPWPPRPKPDLVDIQLVDTMGGALTTFRHHGQTFVLGRRGERYALVLRNRSAERLEVVVSVDGRDVVHGGRSRLAADRGYVLAPHGMVRIEGFRTSMETVAAFRFADRDESFAAQMGDMGSIGIIRMAVFRERKPDMVARDRKHRRMRAAPKSARRRGRLGTEMGESRDSRVQRVMFERDGRGMAQVAMLRYDDEAGLAARGIQIRPPMRPMMKSSRRSSTAR